MTEMVQALFGGGNTAAKKAAQQQAELTTVSQAQQRQTAQDSSATTAGLYNAAKMVRGQRLLLSKESGGLGQTLGTA